MKQFLLFSAIVCMLSGYGVISKSFSSDDKLLDKAEFATGVKKENLRLDKESVSSGLLDVYYNVYDKQNNKYRCYYGTNLVIDSDAICSKITEDGGDGKTSGNCNELLKAAGKC